MATVVRNTRETNQLTSIDRGRADAARVAGILHDGSTTVGAIKALLSTAGLPVRAVA